jgi:hypothetical protein
MPDGKHPGDPAAEVGLHVGSVDTTFAVLMWAPIIDSPTLPTPRSPLPGWPLMVTVLG